MANFFSSPLERMVNIDEIYRDPSSMHLRSRVQDRDLREKQAEIDALMMERQLVEQTSRIQKKKDLRNLISGFYKQQRTK